MTMMRDVPNRFIQTLGQVVLLVASITVGVLLGMIASAIYWLSVLSPTLNKLGGPGWIPFLIAVFFPTICAIAVSHRTRVSVMEGISCALVGGVLGSMLTPQVTRTTSDYLVMSLQRFEFWRFPPCNAAIFAGIVLFGYFACKIFQKDRFHTKSDKPAELTPE